ncbi:unnamed protein product [Linum tenue]|uniref:Uncharacterized protein n=2 Tax=Linum tenue TaxID=586396 RepID=A0AAV0PI98_9ROSI|nr:unnamed protein product [Linum tenue]
MILTTIPTIEFILFIHRHRPPPLTTIASIDIIRRGSSPPLQGDQLPLTPVIVISLFLPPGRNELEIEDGEEGSPSEARLDEVGRDRVDPPEVSVTPGQRAQDPDADDEPQRRRTEPEHHGPPHEAEPELGPVRVEGRGLLVEPALGPHQPPRQAHQERRGQAGRVDEPERREPERRHVSAALAAAAAVASAAVEEVDAEEGEGEREAHRHGQRPQAPLGHRHPLLPPPTSRR